MIRFLFLLTLFCFNVYGQDSLPPFKVMSLNIRYNNPNDGLNAWPKRKTLIARMLRVERPQIAGFQEVLFNQLQFLDSVMTDDQFYGVGRDDGGVQGEFSPIFFRKDRFLLSFAKTFWLSETPEVPGSIGKGAILPRIMTLVRLFDLKSGKNVWVVNTHFSHVSDQARQQSTEILVQICKNYVQGQPLIVLGDFNSEQQSVVYKLLTENDSIKLVDTYFATQSPHKGGAQTFNGFGKNTAPTIIDHIFCSDNFEVTEHYFLPVQVSMTFISDHFPVFAVLHWLTN